MSSTSTRFVAFWVGFAVLFVVLQLVIARERPDGFGIAVLALVALPAAAVLTRSTGRRDR